MQCSFIRNANETKKVLNTFFVFNVPAMAVNVTLMEYLCNLT